MKKIFSNSFILPALVFLMLTLSCSKEEQHVTHKNTTVEGVLLSAADRSPIANGKVLLLSDEKGDLTSAIWYGRSFSARNVLTTNDKGRFSYSFKHSEDTVYAIAAEADGFFPNINSGGYAYPNWEATGLQRIIRGYKNYFTQPNDDKEFQDDKGIVYLPEIRLAPEGWIKFNIENTPPSYNDDLMTLLPENHGAQAIRFNGAIVQSYYLAGPLRAGRFSRILYNVTMQGDFQFYEDSILLEPHDTVTYDLRY